MTNRAKYQIAYRFLVVKLMAELLALSFELEAAHSGRNLVLDSHKTISSQLFLFSTLLTPWPFILLGYYFPLEQFFRQWKELYHTSYNELKGTRARFRYLLNEGRVPVICLLYLGHFTTSAASISSLSARSCRCTDPIDYPLVRDAISFPVASACLLLMVVILARRFQSGGLLRETGAYRFDEPLQLSWADRFYYWLSGVILDYLSKVGIKRNKPNRFERFLFRLNDVLINRLDPRRKKGNKNP